MDAQITVTGLVEQTEELISAKDFEGAENFLLSALGSEVSRDRLVHYELGRMYRRWNKLSSAINHLNHAAELGLAPGNKDEFFTLRVLEELKGVKQDQLSQRP